MRPRQRRRDNRPRQRTFRGLEPFRLRILAAFAFMFLGFAIIGVSLLSVALTPAAEPQDSYQVSVADGHLLRGRLLDATGRVMATSLRVKSLFADPYNIMDIEEAARKLNSVLPELAADDIRAALSKKRRFVWLKRHLKPQQVYAVNSLGIPGLGFREETERFYPQKDVAAHVLGNVNYRGKGVAGIEKGAQGDLAHGEDVRLTLDMRLQNALHNSLEKTMNETEAKGAWGVTLDARTGHIKAMVSLPDYDANHFGEAPKKHWLNKTMGGVYEMGSVFKMFTLATAIESEDLQLDTLLDCTRPLEIDGYKIHDLYPRNAWLTAEEVFVHSSNIGAAQIGEMIGADRQQDTLARLGLFDQYDSGLGHNASTLAPDPYRWGRVQTMSVSFGHGIAVTALQMAAAARAVLVDGIWRQPTITRDTERLPPQKVFSPRTVAMMRKLAAAVVDRGTGTQANIPGYSVGGKTGTSEKNIDGQYVRDKNLASFVGVVPLKNPKLLTFIMVDEPAEGGGGAVAAPAFRRYTQKALMVLGIPPERGVPALRTFNNINPQHANLAPNSGRNLAPSLDTGINTRVALANFNQQ